MISSVTQEYCTMKTAQAVFILTTDEPTMAQAYVMKMPQGIFIGKRILYGHHP
jgi:hypothetical protein